MRSLLRKSSLFKEVEESIGVIAQLYSSLEHLNGGTTDATAVQEKLIIVDACCGKG